MAVSSFNAVSGGSSEETYSFEFSESISGATINVPAGLYEASSNSDSLMRIGNNVVTSVPSLIKLSGSELVNVSGESLDFPNAYKIVIGTGIIDYKIIYANGLYVAAGNNGISTSSNGISWTIRSGTPFSSVAYGNGVFVAVGSSSAVSSDGITWTSPSASPFVSSRNTIAYGNGVFVAAGNGSTGYISSDGESWTTVVMNGFSGKDVKSVRYINDRFIAVGTGGGLSYGSNGTIWQSGSSGTTWELRDVAYGNGVYVAVGTAASVGGVPINNILSSTDGVSFTARSNTSSSLNSIVYAQDEFVAISSSVVAKSTDGITWTTLSFSNNGTQSRAGTAENIGGKVWIPGGGNGTTITSTNFVDGAQAGTDQIAAAAYGNGTYIIGNNAGVIRSSTDGLSWTERVHSFQSTTWPLLSATFGPSGFLVTTKGSPLATSPDGITWTERSVGFTSGTDLVKSAAYGNGLYVIATTTGKIATSPNGISWTTRTSGVSTEIFSCRYINDRFFYTTGSATGRLGISYNGSNWSNIVLPFTADSFDIAYGNGKYVIVSSSGAIYVTDNPYGAWERVLSGTTSDIYSVEFIGGVFVGVGASTVTSEDGINWSSSQSGATLRRIVPTDSGYLATGDSGALYTRPLVLSSTKHLQLKKITDPIALS